MRTSNKIPDWNSAEDSIYILRLFVAGASSLSVRAINNLQKVLDKNLEGRYDLEIIDVHQQPLMVNSEDITALPMLIKKFPQPARRLIGDMSDTDRVLRGLGLP